jgi:hypothetical protein
VNLIAVIVFAFSNWPSLGGGGAKASDDNIG